MAANAIEFAETQLLANGTVQIVASNNGGTGDFFAKGVVHLFTAPDAAATPYQLDLTTAEFDSTATSGDPCIIQISFGDDNNEVEVVLSAADKIRFDAGEITITGVADSWNPDLADSGANFRIPSFIFRSDTTESVEHTSGTINAIHRVDGEGNRVTGAGAVNFTTSFSGFATTAPTYDTLTKTVTVGPARETTTNTNATTATVLNSSDHTQITGTRTMLFAGSMSASERMAFMGIPIRRVEYWTVSGQDGLQSFNRLDRGVWNGSHSGSAPNWINAVNTGDLQYEGNASAPAIPIGQYVVVIFEIDAAETYTVETLFGAFGGDPPASGALRGAIAGSAYLLVTWPDVLTDDYTLRVQSWADDIALNAGWIGTSQLAAGHPYESGVGGGAAPTVTVTAPVESYDRTVSGAPTGAAIAIFKRDGSLLADRSQFTLAAGNDSGDGALVIAETIPNDTPASGFIRVARDDGSEDRLAYSSWSGSTFTLSGTLPTTYSSDNGAYVGYLDVLGSSTGTETVNLQYVSNRDCVLVVALGSGGGRIRPIRQNITLGASDFEFQVSAIADAINTST